MSNGNGENLGDIRVEGISTFYGGEYGGVNVEGVINLKNDLTAKFINIGGVFKAQGKITSDELFCGGVSKIEGSIKAKTAYIEGTIELSGGNFEADKIECTGILSVKEEINANNIKVEGVINAKEIYSNSVEINSYNKNMFGFFSGFSRSKVAIIEATTISIEGVKCDTVNGHNLNIGRKCKIKNVCCDGILNIHPTAKVENITGNYKKQV